MKIIINKRCSKCKIHKPLSEFYKRRGRKSGLMSWCKLCCEKYRIKMAEHYKIMRKRNYPKKREKDLILHYGITLDEYNKIFEQQKGCCAICNKCQSKLKNRLGVDHNHITGKIRGLLCVRCNRLLGFAQESQKILLVAQNYLKKGKNNG